MKISIKAKSSSGDPYDVEFLVESNKLSVFCNCRAGQFGQLCKHKTELLAGDQSRLFDESEATLLDELAKVISRASELREVATQIAESEKTIRIEQATLKRIKKDFAAILGDRFTRWSNSRLPELREVVEFPTVHELTHHLSSASSSKSRGAEGLIGGICGNVV